ncbi:MAG: HU family DNA-binding protein [Prevotella sp.]|nr:HU family DNA-binding protein [Prevotella sp.]
MGKLTIQEIAKVLVEKSGLQQRDANQFATEMFAVILQRLQEGDQVKVKGLGTFKIISVEARESISVRTGERVVIEGHDKVSFTPDNMMKELVNKPFSQFETVVLNDGVAFSDMEEQPEEEPVETIETPIETPAETLVETPTEIEQEPVLEVVVEEQPVVEEPVVVEQPVVEEEPALEEEPLVVVADDEEPEESTFIRPWMKWAAASVLVLVLMAVSALGGYHYALQEVADHGENEAELIIASDLMASAPVQKEEQVAKDTSVVDSTMKTQVKAPDIKPVDKPVDKPEVKPEPKPEVKPEQKPAEEIDPYAAKDERVRLGAYRIVGTKEIVEVQAGQTFYSICKAHLGPDMQCYVEVYNDLPQNPKVKVGQKIKIPQLQLKKRRNR